MAVRVDGVTMRFNDFIAVDDVSFTVEDGEFVCLLGPSGCGKTTLLRLIAGLHRPTGGQILYDEKPLNLKGGDVGFVFQEYALFPWRTVQSNVELGLEITGIPKEKRAEAARRYIELVGLSGFENSLPKELSGGMKQRVGLARALAVDPKVLLMDEPFAALDAQTRNIMQEELLRIWSREHKTVIFVTHSVDESIFLADRIIVMTPRPGRILEDIHVDIPRPRKRTQPEAIELRDRILPMLRQ